MISEFQDLSDKINRLAELTHSLRKENALLRHANARLSQVNSIQADRLEEARRRIHALLAALPPDVANALQAQQVAASAAGSTDASADRHNGGAAQ